MTPKFRQSLYYVGTIIPALLGLVAVWGGLSDDTMTNLSQVIMGVLSLAGATAPAVAAKNIRTQRADGTLETVAPADAVINGVQAVIQAQAQATTELERVRTAVTEAVGAAPVVGPLAQQILNGLPQVPTLADFTPTFSHR